MRAPRWGGGVLVGLENELDAELQLAHTRRRAGRVVALDVSNLSRRASAVDAGITLIAIESEDGMVEHVVCIKPELRSVALRDLEGLH